MVSLGEREVVKREEIGEDDNNPVNQVKSPDHDQDQDHRQVDVVGELLSIVEHVKCMGEYRSTQRKECQTLVRKLKLLLPFLEEIRDLDKRIPEPAIECLKRLKKALHSAKKLLATCHSGSKIYLVCSGFIDFLIFLLCSLSTTYMLI